MPSWTAEYDSDNDSESLASHPPFSSGPSARNTETSYDASSMRSASPTPSVWSMSSSMRANAFKQAYGRELNNYSEIYRLPADDEELDRLNKQHEMFKDIIGKYPPGLVETMQDDASGERKAGLDLGCGSGAWIMEFARDFPHCQAVAVDLVPMQSVTMPDNCRSEVDDINLGLEHFYGDFNIVQARLISSGIRDYRRLIDQVAHCIRPGGFLDMMEFDFHVYEPLPDGTKRRLDLDTETIAGPWVARWFVFASVAVEKAGGRSDAATHLHEWISTHPAFEQVTYADVWLPISPRPDMDSFQKRVGMQMREDVLSFFKSGRPLLLGSGVPENIVDELQVNAEREIRRSTNTHLLRCQHVRARKVVRRPS
ncbi:unnamed protein product [Mycena citricolor]|uniref:S-adenosyl-L-methionine-dependent methyltransferase n=1 Tax=Mycena citricolor TaxID=2018698 RepID=A0AAD2HTV0_9AGAR|nr:unnamed protein product [Mycena citricolor]